MEVDQAFYNSLETNALLAVAEETVRLAKYWSTKSYQCQTQKQMWISVLQRSIWHARNSCCWTHRTITTPDMSID